MESTSSCVKVLSNLSFKLAQTQGKSDFSEKNEETFRGKQSHKNYWRKFSSKSTECDAIVQFFSTFENISCDSEKNPIPSNGEENNICGKLIDKIRL